METKNVVPVLVTFDSSAVTQNILPMLVALTPTDSLVGYATINGKSTGQTALLAVPSGKRFIPTKVLLVMSSASNVTGVATITVGTSAGYDQLVGSTALTDFDANGESFRIDIAAGLQAATVNPATGTVYLNVASAATTTGAGDTYSFTAYLFGLLV